MNDKLLLGLSNHLSHSLIPSHTYTCSHTHTHKNPLLNSFYRLEDRLAGTSDPFCHLPFPQLSINLNDDTSCTIAILRGLSIPLQFIFSIICYCRSTVVHDIRAQIITNYRSEIIGFPQLSLCSNFNCKLFTLPDVACQT